MSAITEASNRLLLCLQQVNRWDASQFQQGLSRETIEEKSKELKFALPQELYELYQWRNGNPLSSSFIFTNYWMLSLENALDVYHLRGSFAVIRDLCGYDNYESKDEICWSRHWFPILHSRDEHRFWVVVIGQEYSPILYIEPGEHCIELYPSLTNMLTAEAECFEKVIELLDGQNCDPDDIKLYPDDMRLMDIRYKHGYQLDYFS